jgi:hypothetical protein
MDYAAVVREEAHRPQYFLVDEDGYSHARGGAYANGQREAMGYTGMNVRSLRLLLREECGVKVALEECEGILAEGLDVLDRGTELEVSVAMSAAERKRRQRERARVAGLCLTCCVRSVHAKADGSMTAKCRECMQAANEQKKRAG